MKLSHQITREILELLGDNYIELQEDPYDKTVDDNLYDIHHTLREIRLYRDNMRGGKPIED